MSISCWCVSAAEGKSGNCNSHRRQQYNKKGAQRQQRATAEGTASLRRWLRIMLPKKVRWGGHVFVSVLQRAWAAAATATGGGGSTTRKVRSGSEERLKARRASDDGYA